MKRSTQGITCLLLTVLLLGSALPATAAPGSVDEWWTSLISSLLNSWGATIETATTAAGSITGSAPPSSPATDGTPDSSEPTPENGGDGEAYPGYDPNGTDAEAYPGYDPDG